MSKDKNKNGHELIYKDNPTFYQPLTSRQALDSKRESVAGTDRPSHFEIDRPLLNAKSSIWYESLLNGRSNHVNPLAENENDNPTGEKDESNNDPNHKSEDG